MLAGIFFIVVGALGFATDTGIMNPAAHTWFGSADGLMFGVFGVNKLMNICHLIFGAFGLIFAFRPLSARMYLLFGGALSLAMWVYGVWVVEQGETISANVFAANASTNLAHAAAGTVMVLLGALAPVTVTYTRVRRTPALAHARSRSGPTVAA